MQLESAEQISSMLASDEFDFRYQSGFPQPVSKISFNDKEKVVAEMSPFFCAGELSRAGATSPRFRTPEVFLTVTAAPKCY